MSRSYPNLGDGLSDWLTSAATPRDADGVIYLSPDVRRYNYHTFAALGTTGHIHVDVTINGAVWHEVAVTLVDDITPNSLVRLIPAGSIAIFRGKFKQFRVRAFDGALAVGSHGWA